MSEPPTDSALNSYLTARARREGAILRLLRTPDPRRGLVHTPREVVQQPFLWRKTAQMMKELVPALRSFLERAGLFDTVCPPPIVFTGAGTSDYVGLSIADLLRIRFQTACVNWSTTRITADPDSFFVKGRRLILFHFARSGNSPESKAVLQIALRDYPDEMYHVVITCNRDGELAACALDHPDRVFLVVLDDACNDQALAMTSSFSNMVLAGQAVAYIDRMDAFIEIVNRMANSGEYLIEHGADAIYELADPSVSRAFYLGNGDLFGGTVESALKVQELTAGQVMAKGEDTLAFRHGPISAVDENTMISFYLSADRYTRRYELDVLLQYQEEFREIGARTVVLSDRAPGPDLDPSVRVLTYDPEGKWQVPVLHQVNVAVLFGQMFGLFASERRGLNVDEPSVDKALFSRTVQGVRIYDDGPSTEDLLQIPYSPAGS